MPCQTVGDLKEVIKEKKPNDFKDIDADKLQLCLAKKKKGAGAWLTEKDVKESVTDTDDLKLLNVAGAPLNLVGLLEKDVKFVPTLEDVESMNTPVHVLVVVPEQAQGQPGLWLVTGSVDNALNTKGIRCRLYWMATLRIGYYDPVRRTRDKNVAFCYEGKKLCFHQLRRALPKLMLSAELQRVFYADYVPEESDSPQNTISSVSLTTSVSNLDTSTDEFEYQRIEPKYYFVPHSKAESCHLVSRKQNRDHKREYDKYDRDPNNRLALSRDMHGWYDGMSSDFPIVNMLPGSVDKNPSIGNRRKVFVKVVDGECTDRVFSRLKEGSTKTDDPLVMKTFVHVEDPETFCFCMRWKYDDNDARQRSFFDMTPAVD
ncbi:unnamed protein product [Phytophthora lilii]|uniref:Unnamed protein product n=1 Tax=Phytophthora lilii TaxID=2077276 RepID=A0A9W6U7H8_9STRA|nr:unnamed protein product [Phytophthora lilii]